MPVYICVCMSILYVHGLTSNHDSADVCSVEVLQHSWCFCLQLVLHDDQTQELHVCLYVIPGSKIKMHTFALMYQKQHTSYTWGTQEGMHLLTIDNFKKNSILFRYEM